MIKDSYISRNKALEKIKEERNYKGSFTFEQSPGFLIGFNEGISFALSDICTLPDENVVHIPDEGIGELSDGYHTFNSLYHQRAVLFATLVNTYKELSWKSWKHEDGEPCFGKENYFIVGIDTPEGSYTYHYHGEYWDLFDCEELPVAKHWDGHTEKDVTRLLSLNSNSSLKGHWIAHQDDRWIYAKCSECETIHDVKSNYCPNCGADMRGKQDG